VYPHIKEAGGVHYDNCLPGNRTKYNQNIRLVLQTVLGGLA